MSKPSGHWKKVGFGFFRIERFVSELVADELVVLSAVCFLNLVILSCDNAEDLGTVVWESRVVAGERGE